MNEAETQKPESMRAYHQRRFERLKAERTPWEAIWQEMDRYLVPGYVRLNPTNVHHDTGNRRRLDIMDNKGQKAHRVFRSGMQSGMTSQARPWFRLQARDPELNEHGAVKSYLDLTTRRMREVILKSNIYQTFHTKYGAHGAVGTAVSYLAPDPRFIIRNNNVICGHYWIAVNAWGRVDTLYHDIPMTAQQIIHKFNRPKDRVPRVVLEAYNKGNRDEPFIVHHAMEPRTHRDIDNPLPEHKPWLSNYWMDQDDDKDRMLRESGTSFNRVIASRWDVVGNDPYGYSLGMDALADIKQLQHEVSRKLEIIDKTSRPPMTAPSAMKGKRHSLLPGSITYSDAAHQGGGYKPAIDLSSYNINSLVEDIRNLQYSIDETFYVDIFMAVTNMPGVQPRNEFEIAERKEERLLQLGPALDRLQDEELRPTISGVYQFMRDAGLLPERPEELESEGDMDIEYTSIMAQAQKAVGVNSIERIGGYIGNLAGLMPEALDKFNADQSIDEYADRIGVPSSIIRSDEEVEEKRKARNEEMAQEKQMAQAVEAAPAMKQGAEAAALLSQVDDTPGDPTRLLDELGLAGPGAL